jgi:ribonuclease HI
LITAPLSDVLRTVGIGPTDWDVLLVGDGSGSGWGSACGWAVVLEDRFSGLRKFFNGGVNAGTNYLAELFPYLHAMCWYSVGPGKMHHAQSKHNGAVHRALRVHIITDAEILVNQGNRNCGRGAGAALWEAMDSFEKRDEYRFFWHWMARDRLGLNILTDHLSRESRLAMNQIKLPTNTNVYDFNPSMRAGG